MSDGLRSSISSIVANDDFALGAVASGEGGGNNVGLATRGAETFLLGPMLRPLM
jgi:hypothetical protein